MKQLLVALATVALALPAAAQDWTGLGGSEDGGVSGSDGFSGKAVLAVDGAGNPILAWEENVGMGVRIYLRRWNPSTQAWEGFGGSDQELGIFQDESRRYGHPAIALDAEGRPFVAAESHELFEEAKTFVHLRRWDGGGWVDIAGGDSEGVVSAGLATATRPSVALDAEGLPTLAWQEKLGDMDFVYLRRWTGEGWEGLGGSDAEKGLGFGSAPVVKIGPELEPVVAWAGIDESISSNSIVFLRRWSGESWVNLSGGDEPELVSGKGDWQAVDPSLALNAEGHPVVAWCQCYDSKGWIFLRQWTGGEWQGLGGSDEGAGLSGDAEGTVASTALALNSDGHPALAWERDWIEKGAGAVLFRRWNGSEWIELAGSGSEGGLSGWTKRGHRPGVGLTSTGRPLVSWNSEGRVFLKRWAGAAPALADLEQRRLDGATPIEPGTLILNEGGFVAAAELVDFEGGLVRLEVELKPAGEDFTGVATRIGAFTTPGLVTLSCPGLEAGSHRWQARAVNSEGNASAWVGFGEEPDDVDAADFRLRNNSAPQLLLMEQRDPLTGLAIPAGATFTSDDGIRFLLMAEDADGDEVRIDFEIAGLGSAYAGSATRQLASGEEWAIPLEVAGGSYRWRARCSDGFGAGSDWVDFGGDGSGAADFSIIVFGGSTGAPSCFHSAAGSPGPWPLVVLLLLARRRS